MYYFWSWNTNRSSNSPYYVSGTTSELSSFWFENHVMWTVKTKASLWGAGGALCCTLFRKSNISHLPSNMWWTHQHQHECYILCFCHSISYIQLFVYNPIHQYQIYYRCHTNYGLVLFVSVQLSKTQWLSNAFQVKKYIYWWRCTSARGRKVSVHSHGLLLYVHTSHFNSHHF